MKQYIIGTAFEKQKKYVWSTLIAPPSGLSIDNFVGAKRMIGIRTSLWPCI